MLGRKGIREILAMEVHWIKRHGLPEWYAIIDGEECTLKMNDFPAEPLYTLEWQDESLDFDDSPPQWSIPPE